MIFGGAGKNPLEPFSHKDGKITLTSAESI